MGKGKNWVEEEESQLCKSWLHVAEDPLVGNQQRADRFWERVKEHFRANLVTNEDDPDFCIREVKALQHKWSQINHDVNKYCGCYAKVKALRESGT